MTLTLTGADLAAIISAVAVLVATVGGLVLQLRTAGKVDSVHALVNGQGAALNELTAKASFAAGVASVADKPRPELPH